MTKPLRTTLTSLILAALLPAAAVASCGGPATPIHRIQSDRTSSPMAGQTVTIEGIVTLDARQQGGFNGFYLQQADHETDNNPATSEALFIYTRKKTGKPGQRLRVTGTVKEFHGLTELVAVRNLTVCGTAPLPQPVEVSLPWANPPEHLENMRVRFSQPLTVTDHYNLARYGELTLASTDQVNPTEYLPPGPKAIAQSQRNQLDRVLLDDGSGDRHPSPVPWLNNLDDDDAPLRAGDRVIQLEGVLYFRFGHWRLQPSVMPRLQRHSPRPDAPAAPAPGNVRVMALNLQNFFNGDGRGNGFPTPRGAESLRQLDVQAQRLRSAILQPRPDILAVSELENDGYGPDSAVAKLAETLGEPWAFIRSPGQDGSDAIRTALLYRTDRVVPAGPPHRLQSGPFRQQGRPPLAQAFRPAAGGEALRVVVPHLKSKSCRQASGQNADRQDGQGCYSHRRSEEARALIRWLDALPAPDRLAGTLVTGDLNSYAMEAPLQRFRQAGYQSQVHRFHPCGPETCPHHSYRYRGEKGSLDYSLADKPLQPRVHHAQTWNINADEAPALAYNQRSALTGPQPWRASDHNPVITDIYLGKNWPARPPTQATRQ